MVENKVSRSAQDPLLEIIPAPAQSTLQPLKRLTATCIQTKLGPMVAVGDDEGLYLLEFLDGSGAKQKLKRLCDTLKAVIVPGRAASLCTIEEELRGYFATGLKNFKTPLCLVGTAFQKKVWQVLQKIPFGATWSYRQEACEIGCPTAFRAVANANGANKLAIIIPCHRVITSAGKTGGYAGGVGRKAWLLAHEQSTRTQLNNAQLNS